MIPRYQKMVFYCLLASIVTMASFLFHERQLVRQRWETKLDETPLQAPASGAEAVVTLDLADDHDGSVTAEERQMALPAETSFRARAVLERLFAEYSLPRSGHPLPIGPGVDDVFLLSWPPAAAAEAGSPGRTLAVINLHGRFVDQLPSGAQTEMLSLLSVLGTFHANFPEIADVRFVVDGRSRETMAGHIDLERAYPVMNTIISASDLQPEP